MGLEIQFSAVIPTYNRGNLVRRAVESALAQEHPPAEIIVVDDGSADDTRQIIESFGSKVRYLYQENAGVSAARNRGVAEAKSDWVAFLDSDDCWLSSHLGRIANAIAATKGDAALYFSDTQVAREDGGHLYWRLCGFEVIGEFELKRDAGDWGLMRIQPMMLQSSAFRRNAFLELGGFADQLRTREDTLLFMKITLLHPACAVSGCGTVMNSDDHIRLTRVYDTDTLVYRKASIFLFSDVLRSVPNMSREHRRRVTNGLSMAYFGMGRVSFRQGDYLASLKSLASSFGVSPSSFAKEVRDSLTNLLGTRERTVAPLSGGLPAKETTAK